MLTPDGSLLVIVVLFLVLVPIVNRILFKPITHVLDERERLTTGSHADAKAILKTVDVRLGDYEEGIRSARAEGYRIVESRRTVATLERQQKIDATRADVDRKIADARGQINADAAEARTRLESDARDIANRISSTLLGRAVGGSR
jgi:F-type H+-transporting ATPase subunit b